MAIWAVYGKRTPQDAWRLAALSVLSAERARGLAEREHARAQVVGVQYRVCAYDSPRDVPWT